METHYQYTFGMKRIVITGAESTGKTTLTQELANHFTAPYSDEYARKYAAEINREITTEDIDPIARGQLAIEERAEAQSQNGWVLHDTNLLSTQIYSTHYFNSEISWLKDVLQNRTYAHYFLCMPDIPWVEDPGQRESPEARDVLHEKFLAALQIKNVPYTCISGDRNARLKKAIQTIEALRI
jgi:NadR type nicotinamide-nucleotide adenylyltransferase